MLKVRSFLFAAAICIANAAFAQEAASGLDLRATLTAGLFEADAPTQAPRIGSRWVSGIHALLYPTWKLSDGWSFSGAIQIHSRPYHPEEMRTQGYGLKTDILQATVNYSRFGENGSIVLRAGTLTTAFGSFLLRYDESVNPLIRVPQTYGYYYSAVSTLGLMGGEVDATFKKLDTRLQFVNSSPSNRRSVFDRDQYGNWAGGVGYTIRQGLRVGGSFFEGPYLSQRYPYYFPGEASPHQLPAHGVGRAWLMALRGLVRYLETVVAGES